jgi:hypothetical protein
MAREQRKQTNKEYLSYIADRIASERPSGELIFKTLTDIDERAYGRGYRARITDSAKFREWKQKKREESWNSVKDHLDDCVHKNKDTNQ